MSYNRERTNITIRNNFSAKNPKDRDTVFTLNMLKHPKLTITNDMEDKPLFTYAFYFPYDILVRLPYQDIVQFFFSREYGEQFFLRYAKNITMAKYSEETLDENEEEEFYKEREKIIDANVKTMLKLLFQTTPSSENVSDSLEYVKTGRNPIALPNMKQLLGQSDKVQIDMKGKLCTFEKITWLNDVLNHPDYNDLLNTYIRFITWSNGQVRRANINIKKLKREITKICNQIVEKSIELYTQPNATDKLAGTQLTYLFKFELIYLILSDDVNSFDTIDIDGFFEAIKDNLKERIEEERIKNRGIYIEPDDIDTATIERVLETSNSNTEFLINLIGGRLIDDNISPGSRRRALNEKELSMEQAITKQIAQMKNLITSSTNGISFLNKTPTRIENYRKKTYDDVRRSGDANASEYSNFITKLQKNFQSLGPPPKETTNHELQTMIDMNTSDDVENFFRFMEDLHKHYILGQPQTDENRSKQLLELMDTGITIVRGNSNDINQSINLTILCELRPTEQTKDVKLQTCKNRNEHLGKLVQNMVRSRTNKQMLYENKNTWNVDFNRPRIETANVGKSSSSSSRDYNYADQGNRGYGYADQGNRGYGYAEQPKRQTNKEEAENETNSSFVFTSVVNSLPKDKKKQLADFIDEINRRSAKETMTEFNVLDTFAKDKMNEAQSFRKVVSDFAKDTNIFSTKVLNNLTRLKGEIQIKIDTNTNILAGIRKEDATRLEERKKLKYENAKCNLLLFLVTVFMEEENKKQKVSMRGGRKTQKHKKRYNVSRTYKRYI